MNVSRTAVVLAAIVMVSAAFAQSNTLEVYSVDPFALLKVKESLRATNSPFMPAYKKLLRDVEEALDMEPVSVTEKSVVPPSGDKHDYMSLSRYWWPDPAKPDGLPWIRRDGETNPETEKIPDWENFGAMSNAVSTLGLAHFFTGNESYARHAVRMVRIWFLDSITAMNPNLQYSQSVPGRSEGRGSGILDGRNTAAVIDAVGMINGSAEWTPADDAALRTWFARYVEWLTESPNGKDEFDAPNNHGTWYAAHVVPAAMYVGKKGIAANILRDVITKRIAAQIGPDGSQKAELARTRPWHYSWFNLDAYLRLAIQARRVGIDLWNTRGPEGQSLKAAVDFLMPFLRKEKTWPYDDLDGVKPAELAPRLVWLAAVTGDLSYLELARKSADTKFAQRREFLFTGIDPSTEP